ncbi:MAG: tetratricopeptide repeat protein [Leptolyngbya sp. RL_3_1]|nr:tetratricopeptide repeat protein [Leptolyngbya sp. RL_3_1]
MQGRPDEAEPLFQKALILHQKLFGYEHPDVALSLNNLAGVYTSQGRYNEAESLYLKTIAIAHVTLGMEHPNARTAINNFQICLVSAIQAGETSTLSDHPTTQAMLKELQEEKAPK